MLSHLDRLPKQIIKEVMRCGERVTSEELMLRYRKTSEHPRFAFVISTKVDKRATQRNRTRRILSESVRHLLPRVTGVDGVIMVRKNIAGLSQAEAEKRIVDLLGRAKLL